MDRLDEAQEFAQKLKVMIEELPIHRRLYFHLLGLMEKKKGNWNKAIEYLEESLALYPSTGMYIAEILDALADTYHKSGDLDNALRCYEKTTPLNIRLVYDGHIYARSLYRMGNIYEEKGWTGKAIESYEKFLELWKDADPDLPEVLDAKKRLAALTK